MSDKKKEITYTLEVEDDYGKTYSCTLKKPGRAILGQATGMIMPVGDQVPDVSKAGEWILKNCFLDGDKEILEDEDLCFAASMQCMEMVQMRTTRLKKN